ncbi:MAG: LuxR C-terminal-related transcriptional regulator [Planctomycetota bacterium]
MTRTQGVGISVMDRKGGLIYVNETSLGLFFSGPVDYEGKTIEDLHPAEFVQERLEMIRRVLDEDRPLVIEHIFHGRPISSAVWPIHDVEPPYQRVLVISRRHPRFEESGADEPSLVDAGFRQIEVIDTAFIELGDLDVLTPKELEVLALIGHGLSVPKVARLLKRSQKTIENHKASITHKLHLKGQSEMVAIVTSLGLDVDDAKRKRMSSAPHRK